jgi:hypothetical protein
MHHRQNLLLAWAASGSILFFVQLAIWNQINDRLPAKQQIRWQMLKEIFIWFQEGGLLAQHERLYPESRLRIVFRLLWGTFWVLAAFSTLAR